MQLCSSVEIHPKNLAGIRAVLGSLGDGQVINLEDYMGTGRLEWKTNSDHPRHIYMSISMDWLSDPAKVHLVQEAARQFCGRVVEASTAQ